MSQLDLLITNYKDNVIAD